MHAPTSSGKTTASPMISGVTSTLLAASAGMSSCESQIASTKASRPVSTEAHIIAV